MAQGSVPKSFSAFYGAGQVRDAKDRGAG